MIRLDKYLCEIGIGTRSTVKKEIKSGNVTVNGKICKNADEKIDEEKDRIQFCGKDCNYEKYVYYLLHKPAGFVTATKDNFDRTVMELIHEDRTDLFPVGRLDKDTEGLLLITNDGELSHQLLSPRKHVEKEYECELREVITKDMISALENGVDIGEKELTKPAIVSVLDEHKISLTITEGKFHQVKRMLKAVGNEVTYLKRIRMGALILPNDLDCGYYRKIAKQDIIGERTDKIQEKLNSKNDKQNAITQKENSISINQEQHFDAVIFDLDGSLVDSMWIWRNIDIEYLGKFGIELPENLQSCIEGMSFSETADYFKERFPIPDSVEQMKADWNAMAWDKYANEVPVKQGVLPLLHYCKENGIKLGIATSNSRELVTNIMETHGLDKYFDCIMTGCDVKRGKPAPDIYLAVAKELDVKPERCLVFEDIIPGIQAGQAAGMKVCAVKDAYSMHQDAEKRNMADYYTEHFTELMEQNII